MFYIRRHLAPGERIIQHTALHWVSFIRQLLFFSFAVVIYPSLRNLTGHPAPGMVLVGIGATALLVALLRFWIEEYVVTNRNVISRWGIVRRDVFVYPLGRIEAVDVQQGLLGRLLGYGTIEIHTAAERDGVASRRFVNNPERWRAAVLDAIGSHEAGVPAGNPAAAVNDPAGRLRRLEQLLQERLITEEEYRQRRSEILREL